MHNWDVWASVLLCWVQYWPIFIPKNNCVYCIHACGVYSKDKIYKLLFFIVNKPKLLLCFVDAGPAWTSAHRTSLSILTAFYFTFICTIITGCLWTRYLESCLNCCRESIAAEHPETFPHGADSCVEQVQAHLCTAAKIVIVNCTRRVAIAPVRRPCKLCARGTSTTKTHKRWLEAKLGVHMDPQPLDAYDQ